MSNINPSTPSFVFGYWRPWKENSNFFDSYLDYAKDTSLVKYGADTVGMYINQASKEQVQAINQIGQAIGRGMNVLSNQMSDINQTLFFLNRNIDIQIEQQKLSNLLLQNIAELLRVPDSEKERQHCIELGIKFFVNASKDSDLYADALEELLKAESLMKQDYFVLHRIGCIYLYVEKYINPEKALDYFIRAAKYASVESDPKAARLADILGNNKSVLNFAINKTLSQSPDKSYGVILKEAGRSTFHVLNAIIKLTGLSSLEANNLLSGAPKTIKNGIDKTEAESIKKTLEEAGAIVIISNQNPSNQISVIDSATKSAKLLNQIGLLASDSYEKAAFAAYVMGRFSDAINYQSKALNFDNTPKNRFLMAKYQVRGGEIAEGIINLSKCIEDEPVYSVAAFKEIDLINAPEVLKLISKKNQQIDNSLNMLLDEWKGVQSTKSVEAIKELTNLSKKSYEIKVSKFLLFKEEANSINNEVKATKAKIDNYIKEINGANYCSLKPDKIQKIIDELIFSKDLPLEKMQAIFFRIKKEIDADKLQIGSKFAGGIVFYLDSTEKHGLVCADKDFGKAIWGGDGEIGASGNGIGDGIGLKNTKKILDLSSWYVEKGFFSTKYIPAPTAGRLCLESKYNGYSDWYLPTYKELNLIYESLFKNGIGNFTDEHMYWSSTESNKRFAFSFRFNFDGESGEYFKDAEIHVRGVRSF